ncbi:hypothetical protein GCM10010469_30670 [Streptomyces labedae]|uniref:Uncharacterized protein n=2 Tax=Streptomyces TaxID=1883 RepID=A0ABQ2U223_9ACTN|nr:hypothetical protein GCM10010265_20100 [Streptomyces griseoincarnatus]GGT63466.1 hypothetical protein GCM10010287_42580 [Streptomyces variabilis]
MLHVSGPGEGAGTDAPAADVPRGPEAPDEHPVRTTRAAASVAPYRAVSRDLDRIMMIFPFSVLVSFGANGPCRSRGRPAGEGPAPVSH